MALCERCQREIELTRPDPEWFDLDGLRIGSQRMTRQQAVIIDRLWRASPRYMTGESLAAALYRDTDGPQDEQYGVIAHIYRLRRRLGETPYTIETVRGCGYRLIRRTP